MGVCSRRCMEGPIPESAAFQPMRSPANEVIMCIDRSCCIGPLSDIAPEGAIGGPPVSPRLGTAHCACLRRPPQIITKADPPEPLSHQPDVPCFGIGIIEDPFQLLYHSLRRVRYQSRKYYRQSIPVLHCRYGSSLLDRFALTAGIPSASSH